jgi:type III restriction enzyme
VHLILETKGFDPLEAVKTAAAKRWVAAVNADGSHGRWRYAVAKRIVDIAGILSTATAATPARRPTDCRTT